MARLAEFLNRKDDEAPRGVQASLDTMCRRVVALRVRSGMEARHAEKMMDYCKDFMTALRDGGLFGLGDGVDRVMDDWPTTWRRILARYVLKQYIIILIMYINIHFVYVPLYIRSLVYLHVASV
jgi:hypothetical protein